MPSIDLGRITPIPKGTWVSSTTYERLDIVNNYGNSYIAKQDVPINTSITTEQYWQPLIENSNYITPEMFGAKGDSITDDSNAIKNMFNYGIQNNIKNFIFNNNKIYIISGKISEQNGLINYFYLFENINGINIFGTNSTLKYIESSLPNQCSVLCFRGCSNVKININGECNTYDPSTNAPVIAFIHCIGENKWFEIKGKFNNLRYGFRSGNYGDTINTINTGITFLKADVECEYVGYPIAIELGSFINCNIKCKDYHRVCYLCGVDHAIINAEGISTEVNTAGIMILLKDNIYSNNGIIENKGCSNIKLFLKDNGTKNPNGTATAALGINSYGNSGWTMVNDVYFKNIEANIQLKKGGITTGTAFSSQTTSQNIYYDNINIKINDEVESNTTENYSLRVHKFEPNYSVKNMNIELLSERNILFGNNSSNIDIKFKNCKFYQGYLYSLTTEENYIFEDCDFNAVKLYTGLSTESNSTKSIIFKNCNGKTSSFFTSNFEKYRWISDKKSSGPTSNRPTGPNDVPHKGFTYFDTTEHKFYYYSDYNTWTQV